MTSKKFLNQYLNVLEISFLFLSLQLILEFVVFGIYFLAD